jgi:hypothetical protein
MAAVTAVPTVMLLPALLTLVAFIAREAHHARKALDSLPNRTGLDRPGGPDPGDAEHAGPPRPSGRNCPRHNLR